MIVNRALAFGAVVLSNGLIQSFYVPTLPLIGQAYYVVGATVSGLVVYGLDVAERYRNLPFICTYDAR